MKKKAILIGARAGFDGPPVFLEAGLWALSWNIEAQERVILLAEGVKEDRAFGLNGRPIEVTGPCRLRARVSPDYDGPGIHIDASRLARA